MLFDGKARSVWKYLNAGKQERKEEIWSCPWAWDHRELLSKGESSNDQMIKVRAAVRWLEWGQRCWRSGDELKSLLYEMELATYFEELSAKHTGPCLKSRNSGPLKVLKPKTFLS